jgi:hypothetical protein
MLNKGSSGAAKNRNPPQSKKMKYALKNKVVPSEEETAKKPTIVTRQEVASPLEVGASETKKQLPNALEGNVGVSLRVGGSEAALTGSFDKTATLQEALDELLLDGADDWTSFEIRYPSPRSNSLVA